MKFFTPHTFTVYPPNGRSGVNPTSSYTIGVADRAIRIDLPAKVLVIKIADEN